MTVVVRPQSRPIIVTSTHEPLAVVVSPRRPGDPGDDGEPGPPGPAGPVGPAGPEGDSTKWIDGVGPPQEPIPGAEEGDYYLDTSTGDVYVLGTTTFTVRSMVPGVLLPVAQPRVKSLVPGGT